MSLSGSHSGRCALVLSLALALSGCESKSPRAAQSSPDRAEAPRSVTDPEAEAKTATQGGRKKVAFLGDSITAGMGLSEDEAYPALLRARFAEQGRAFQVANAGLSGDTSAGGLRRVDWLLKQKPDVVVVELGANDGLRGTPVAELERNLSGILRKVSDHGACPLLLGMVVPPSLGAEYTQAFAAVYPRLAEQLNVAWVPFFMKGVAGIADLNLEDGLHPTAEGQRIIADNVEPALSRALEGCTHGTSAP